MTCLAAGVVLSCQPQHACERAARRIALEANRGTLILLVRNLVTMRLADSRLRSISPLHPQPTVRHHHIRLSALGTLRKTNTVSVNLPFHGSESWLHVFPCVSACEFPAHPSSSRHDVLSPNVASFPLHGGSLFQARLVVICLTCTPGYDSN